MNGEEPRSVFPNRGIPWSGPIDCPRSSESRAIQAAPAYDVAAARAYIPHMPQLRAMIDGIRDGDGLVSFGRVAPSKEAFGRLEAEIRKLTQGNHKVSLLMADLRTRSGVAYRSNVPMCAQSTVKAIYVGALIDSRPEALEENGRYMRDAVEFSANEPYHRLRRIYGKEPLVKWCREAGVDPAFAEPMYPRDRTARDMFKLWTRLYCFLNDGSDGTNFGAYYADSSCSATRKKLGDRYPVQTKAGWECGLDESRNYDPFAEIPAWFTDGDPTNDECAINDTGVVYTENGPYIFVIYTDHPFGVFRDYATPNPLYDLTEALCEVQASIAAASGNEK